jgi:phytol kinase
LRAGALGLSVGIAFALLAARLRRVGVRVAYTRKVFHFGIFSGAAAAHATWSLPGTNAYGSAVALLVVLAVLRGEGDPLYEALARESDSPKRSLFVVVPLVTTALGGLASALLTGPFASVGFLVTGWGDAVGEPVGSRWGRHPYRVPSLAGVPAQRTVEGTLAVLLASWAAAALALGSLGAAAGLELALVALACGGAAAAVEAVSHHGTDNLTVQVAVSLLAAWLAG